MSKNHPGESDIEMVPCHMGHAAVLATLHADAFDSPWTERAFAELVVQISVSGWIACSAEPKGFILIRQASDEAEILTLAVRKTARRSGIASALVAHALAHAAKTGTRFCYLEVALDNVGARAVYEMCGFEQSGHRPAYYRRGNQRVDALVMSRTLGEGGTLAP